TPARPAHGVLDLLLDLAGGKRPVFSHQLEQTVVAELLAIGSASLRNTVGKEQYPVAGRERDFALFEGPILDGAKRGAAVRKAQERAVAARQDGSVLAGIRVGERFHLHLQHGVEKRDQQAGAEI